MIQSGRRRTMKFLLHSITKELVLAWEGLSPLRSDASAGV